MGQLRTKKGIICKEGEGRKAIKETHKPEMYRNRSLLDLEKCHNLIFLVKIGGAEKQMDLSSHEIERRSVK